MAPISGRPFLEIQLDYLIDQGIESATLCTGHLSEVIEKHFQEKYKSIAINYSIETSPLGTGGAIKKALIGTDFQHVVVLNGDSYFGADLRKMMHHHLDSNANMTLALKHLHDFDRYGTVVFDKGHTVRQFKEKEATKSGWINGGVYILNRSVSDNFPEETVFSFEEFMTRYVGQGGMKSFLSDGYFIDIGIPVDYAKGQTTLPLLADIKYNGWTLFLDRDGVINHRIPDSYIKKMDEWKYTENAVDAICQLSLCFDRIVVVTNQAGVPKKLMSSYSLDLIHQNLKDDVSKNGGCIDHVYASLDLKEKENNSRKPNIDMALWAQRDFPEIDFSKSIMVGDSASDIAFGKNAGMKTVWIKGKEEDTESIKKLNPNWAFDSLDQMSEELIK